LKKVEPRCDPQSDQCQQNPNELKASEGIQCSTQAVIGNNRRDPDLAEVNQSSSNLLRLSSKICLRFGSKG
jgi:hypothetical protein